jgi:hypothetical protein
VTFGRLWLRSEPIGFERFKRKNCAPGGGASRCK